MFTNTSRETKIAHKTKGLMMTGLIATILSLQKTLNGETRKIKEN